MKNTVSTLVVTSTIFCNVSAKLNIAINHYAEKSVALKWAKSAENDLFLLEAIFYCEGEKAIENELKKICIYSRLANSSDCDEIKQVLKDCYQKVKDLENEISELINNNNGE